MTQPCMWSSLFPSLFVPLHIAYCSHFHLNRSTEPQPNQSHGLLICIRIEFVCRIESISSQYFVWSKYLLLCCCCASKQSSGSGSGTAFIPIYRIVHMNAPNDVIINGPLITWATNYLPASSFTTILLTPPRSPSSPFPFQDAGVEIVCRTVRLDNNGDGPAATGPARPA